ncbi:hypothetical protein ACFWG7_15120 [Streptomyces koyangensis]|uniref:hypothetical protein n=1 Tax=Streptomyces koyangensis TaxID=188770 RepID=UPI00365548C6
MAAKSDHPVLAALSLTFSVGWSWAACAFLIGWFCRTKTLAALLASAGLATGVTVYYVFKYLSPALPPGVTHVTSVSLSPGIAFWSVAALLLGAPLGLAGHLARRPDLLALPFQLTVPAIAFYEATMRFEVETDPGDAVGLVTWTVVRIASVAVALGLVGRAGWSLLRPSGGSSRA